MEGTLHEDRYTVLIISRSSMSCKSTIYFRRHKNIMIYLVNFNITYIIILATCFDSCESSSGINFQELFYIFFYSFMSYNFYVLVELLQ